MIANERRDHIHDGCFLSRERIPPVRTMEAESAACQRGGRHERHKIVVDAAVLPEIVVELRRDPRTIVHYVHEVEHRMGRRTARQGTATPEEVGQPRRVKVAVVVGVELGKGRVLVVNDELQLRCERVAEDQDTLFGLELVRDALKQPAATFHVCAGRADLLESAEDSRATLGTERGRSNGYGPPERLSGSRVHGSHQRSTRRELLARAGGPIRPRRRHSSHRTPQPCPP
jgi:hypothetical protein